MVNSDFSLALQAAEQLCARQDFPKGVLYVIASPIGNLADISLRALAVLARLDVLACEDTRCTGMWLKSLGLSLPLMAVHEHNEQQASDAIVDKLRAGLRVGLVSDAGTPAISDPGARLVARVHEAGLRVVPVPGVSSVVTAMSVAGVHSENGFVFTGFVPAQAKARQSFIESIQQELRASVLFESPHRLLACARDLGVLGERKVTLCKEITKQFEEVVVFQAHAMESWLQTHPEKIKGEWVIVVHASHVEVDSTRLPQAAEEALSALLEVLPLNAAVKLAAHLTQASRNALYERALELQRLAKTDQQES